MKRSKMGVRSLRRGFIWLLGLYSLYLLKSALGINLLPNYSAAWVLKLPIQPILDARHGSNWRQ